MAAAHYTAADASGNGDKHHLGYIAFQRLILCPCCGLRVGSTRLGLPRQVAVAVGVIDAHSGAIGAGIEPHSIVRIMGTSTCDIAVASYGEIDGRCIGGICGQVDGSVLPGMIGMEAGQSTIRNIKE